MHMLCKFVISLLRHNTLCQARIKRKLVHDNSSRGKLVRPSVTLLDTSGTDVYCLKE